jgi:SAM-dependent methyltransferase
MARSAFGRVWEREVLCRLLDHGMRGVEPVRAEVAGQARGRVLELGIGTGASLPHLGPGVEELVAVEPASELAAIARERVGRWAAERGAKGTVIEGSATRPLPLEDGSFDGVLILFVLCSIEKVDATLAQAHRLLKPGGALLLAEHVAADADPVPHPARERAQRLIRPAWKLALGGCDPHKSLDAVLARSGFDVRGLEHRELDLPWVVRSGLVGRAPRR